MAKPIENYFEDKARDGDSGFAIAYTLLKLAETQERLATKVGQLGFDGPGKNPGALEYIGMELRDLGGELNPLSVSIDNG